MGEGNSIEGKAPDGPCTVVAPFIRPVTWFSIWIAEEVHALAAPIIKVLFAISHGGMLAQIREALITFPTAPVISFLVLIPDASAPDSRVAAPIPNSTLLSETAFVGIQPSLWHRSSIPHDSLVKTPTVPPWSPREESCSSTSDGELSPRPGHQNHRKAPKVGAVSVASDWP